jgi:uncharacterized protein (DUF2147 family)
MKKLTPLITCLLMLLPAGFAQGQPLTHAPKQPAELFQNKTEEARRIEGKWYTKNRKAKVWIYLAQNGHFVGKITELKEPLNEDGEPKRDINNPDPEKRDRKVKGLYILKGFDYDPDEQEWEDGTIYDPDNGKTYDCYLALESEDKLKVRGYVGVSMLGRTQYWHRAE